VDTYGTPDAFRINADLEFRRNQERYALLRWAQKACTNFAVVPPDTGIVHQVNLEYLARTVFPARDGDAWVAYPDSVVGTDSHTTMINGLGVLGWGVGGIEAEACMLGQPTSFLIPQVVGFRLRGTLSEGSTATDLVLTVTQMLRKRGVVGMFVEFFGDGLSSLALADRATIANMAPEYGATCGIFPIDGETLEYLRLTGRTAEQVALVEAYARAQGLWREPGAPEAQYTDVLDLDLRTVVPSLAGPRRPQDRIPLRDVAASWKAALPSWLEARTSTKLGKALALTPEGAGVPPKAAAAVAVAPPPEPKRAVAVEGRQGEIGHGAVVIAAITSCTNTSNPAVMVAAGLVAKKAVERGLHVPPWVKTSLAPGSKVVTEYLRRAGLLPYLEKLRFHLVGYGCTTCIGNSGPLPDSVSHAISEGDLVVAAVLSGNRNFEGRIHPEVRANYLASPPIVVAYALAGRVDLDLYEEPLGEDDRGRKVYLKDVWPSAAEVRDVVREAIDGAMFRRTYADVFAGEATWRSLPVPEGDLFAWDASSTYVRRPPYFDGMTMTPPPLRDVKDARVLVMLGDSVTTDHISPAGNIAKDSPAGKYLLSRSVPPEEFNSYGARRGNHEVMIRGTFANVRLRNELVRGREGWWTRHLPSGETTTIFDASVRYAKEGVPLIAIAGKEYGSGSSRDWAAKGTLLLGIRAIVAESYERIHRSNLIGMGVLPLQFLPGQDRKTLGLTGEETYSLVGLSKSLEPLAALRVEVQGPGGARSFDVRCRIDTKVELEYYRHGGILPYVLRQIRAR
jgi:aconitate hydratase